MTASSERAAASGQPDDRSASGASSALRRLRRALLWAAVAGAVALQWVAAVEQSWTGDEPYHLLAGYQALAFGLDTVNLEHPPLVKLVAAAPLLVEERAPWQAPVSADRALPATERLFDDPALAERVRVRSRLLLSLVFALPLLLGCFWLGRVVAGTDAGLLLAAAVGLSPGALPYLSLAQTDAAVALGFVVSLTGCVLLVRRGRLLWAAVAGAGLGVALAAKLSAVLLGPVVVGAVVLIPGRAHGGRQLLRRLGLLAAAGVLALAIPYGIYAFADRADPGPPLREAIDLYTTSRATLLVDDELLPWRDRLLAVQEVSSVAARWALGFLGVRAQNEIGVYPSYAFGAIDSDGRWWYFPAAFLVRTPLVLLAALAAAAWAARPAVRSGGGSLHGRERWLLAGAALLYLGFAFGSSYNIGVRHLLPVLPLLYLPAAAWAARRDLRATVVAGVLLVEALALTPVWMSVTNTWWLGPANPTRHALGGSDGDYEQGLRTLAREARRRGIETLRVVHPTATPGEVRAAIPGAVRMGPESAVEPGWYAVSILVEQLVPAILEAEPEDLYAHATYRSLAERWDGLWRQIRRRGEDQGYAAGTFHLYRVSTEPDPLLPAPGESSRGAPNPEG